MNVHQPIKSIIDKKDFTNTGIPIRIKNLKSNR